jgi:hypothetical protein
MNKFVKQVIEEKFQSKAQQRLFYAKANEKGASKKEKKKWAKWADEFSDDTDFKKIPEKVEKEVDEIVDEKGNIQRGNKPTDLPKKGITSKSTSTMAAKTGAGSMGTHGVHGTHTSLRYWAESDMSSLLGYEDTLGKDLDVDAAREVLKKKGITDPIELETRLQQMGYMENSDKVVVVENPKEFMRNYMETVLLSKSTSNEIVSNDGSTDEKEIPKIIQRQINSLKNSLKGSGLSLKDIEKEFKS